MSITVTVEELRAYESAMEEWFAKRMSAASEAKIHDMGGDYRMLKWPTVLGEWVKSNPPPKLIPTV